MRTKWEDEVKDQDGEIIQEGTPLSAKNMNNIEERVEYTKTLTSELVQKFLQIKRKLNETFTRSRENYFSISAIFQNMMQIERSVDNVKGEIIEVTLTNKKVYPFNNSEKTISLATTRDYLNYEVVPEIMSGEQVGNILIYDKQTNGFKIKYTGSAKKAEIRLHIRGGMN